MANITFDKDYIKQGFTLVDNLFVADYLPKADGDDVRIYLFALAAISSNRLCDISSIAINLGLPEERVQAGFDYWNKQGLITYDSQGNIRYLSVKEPLTPVIKYNTKKYQPFVEMAERIFPERLMVPQELNRYIEFMASYEMEINAMLLIMQYCKNLGGSKQNTAYILTVAKNFAEDGLLKESQVQARLADIEINTQDMQSLFLELGLKRAPNLDDKNLLISWKNELGFTFNAIITAARTFKKRGSMDKLDAFMHELSTMQVSTAEEIAEYSDRKEQVNKLVVSICAKLGQYIGAAQDNYIKAYIIPWLNLGFESEALVLLAEYSFYKNIHSLEVMQQNVELFSKQGIFTKADMEKYIEKEKALDAKILELYQVCEYIGNITKETRQTYLQWEEWGFDTTIIQTVAKFYANKSYPFTLINRTLGELKIRNMFDLEQVTKYLEEKQISEKSDTSSKQPKKENYDRHRYTQEEINGGNQVTF